MSLTFLRCQATIRVKGQSARRVLQEPTTLSIVVMDNASFDFNPIEQSFTTLKPKFRCG